MDPTGTGTTTISSVSSTPAPTSAPDTGVPTSTPKAAATGFTIPVSGAVPVTDPMQSMSPTFTGSDPTTPTAPVTAETTSPAGSASVEVYRFFDSQTGTHFYTTSSAERNAILQSRPDLIPEGAGGVGLRAVSPTANDPNAVQVFRFFDTLHGTQISYCKRDRTGQPHRNPGRPILRTKRFFLRAHATTSRRYRGLSVLQQHRRHALLYRQSLRASRHPAY